MSAETVAAEILVKATNMLKGRSTKEELEKLYQETVGKTPPPTTAAWLKEAIIRTVQVRHYEESGIQLPDRVKKNNDEFFSAPVPQSFLDEEKKKESAMAKKQKSENGAEKKQASERKNKSDEALIALKSGSEAAVDEIIKKQKAEHVKAQMTIIREAGTSGITIAALTVETPKRLKDKSTWEKYPARAHINYVLKKLADLVTVTQKPA